MKILHLSFHRGCINDFNYVCDKFGYNVEVLSSIKECNTNKDLSTLTLPNAQHYNITHKRAEYYWNKYKD